MVFVVIALAASLVLTPEHAFKTRPKIAVVGQATTNNVKLFSQTSFLHTFKFSGIGGIVVTGDNL